MTLVEFILQLCLFIMTIFINTELESRDPAALSELTHSVINVLEQASPYLG